MNENNWVYSEITCNSRRQHVIKDRNLPYIGNSEKTVVGAGELRKVTWRKVDLDCANKCEGLEKAEWEGERLKPKEKGNKISKTGRRITSPSAQKKWHDNREIMPALVRLLIRLSRTRYGQAVPCASDFRTPDLCEPGLHSCRTAKDI